MAGAVSTPITPPSNSTIDCGGTDCAGHSAHAAPFAFKLGIGGLSIGMASSRRFTSGPVRALKPVPMPPANTRFPSSTFARARFPTAVTVAGFAADDDELITQHAFCLTDSWRRPDRYGLTRSLETMPIEAELGDLRENVAAAADLVAQNDAVWRRLSRLTSALRRSTSGRSRRPSPSILSRSKPASMVLTSPAAAKSPLKTGNARQAFWSTTNASPPIIASEAPSSATARDDSRKPEGPVVEVAGRGRPPSIIVPFHFV